MTNAPVKKKREHKGGAKLNGQRILISGLTVEDEAYCRARALGMSPEEALSASGGRVTVTTVRAWESRRNKGYRKAIVDRINELTAIAEKNAILKSGLDREWVISRLMSTAERCMQNEPVLDKEGNETGVYKFDSYGAIQALKALGDTLGLFKPADKKIGEEFEHLSDEDLTRIATELAAQTGLLEAPEGNQAPTGLKQVIEVQALSEAD